MHLPTFTASTDGDKHHVGQVHGGAALDCGALEGRTAHPKRPRMQRPCHQLLQARRTTARLHNDGANRPPPRTPTRGRKCTPHRLLVAITRAAQGCCHCRDHHVGHLVQGHVINGDGVTVAQLTRLRQNVSQALLTGCIMTQRQPQVGRPRAPHKRSLLQQRGCKWVSRSGDAKGVHYRR